MVQIHVEKNLSPRNCETKMHFSENKGYINQNFLKKTKVMKRRVIFQNTFQSIFAIISRYIKEGNGHQIWKPVSCLYSTALSISAPFSSSTNLIRHCPGDCYRSPVDKMVLFLHHHLLKYTLELKRWQQTTFQV